LGFLVAVCKKQQNTIFWGAAQVKDNNDDKIIVLALPTLKNNTQQTMVTEHRSRRTRQAMEGWERELKKQRKDGAREWRKSQSQ
jgi:hypothetical protein